MISDLSKFSVKGVSCPMCFVEGGTMDIYTGFKEVKGTSAIPSFYLGKYLVTQELYEVIMGENPSYFKSGNRPVENVSWHDAQSFLKKINALLDKEFRLPSALEWEFAAIGGIYSQNYKYCGSNYLTQVGWYDENSGDETKPVGVLLPNELGLYDMSGNISELCEDDWHSNKEIPKDGSAFVEGVTVADRSPWRVVCGTGYNEDYAYCRPTSRLNWEHDYRDSTTGFRIAYSLVE